MSHTGKRGYKTKYYYSGCLNPSVQTSATGNPPRVYLCKEKRYKDPHYLAHLTCFDIWSIVPDEDLPYANHADQVAASTLTTERSNRSEP